MDSVQVDGDGENIQEVEVVPALISVHPQQLSVAVALGPALRVFDLQKGCRVSLSGDSGDLVHKDSIRAIRYSSNGKLLVSGGDDKLVKIWSTYSWRLLSSVRSEKRVSAITVSNEGSYVCYADKFGVVWAVVLGDFNDNDMLPESVALPLFAHYCSIITSLEFSPNGEFIISADRDFKIRVTVFPKDPSQAAHEIQSFCLGHTEYVSSLAFISSENSRDLLVSGSGDSTVRLWDFASGSLLDTFDASSEAKYLEWSGHEVDSTAVTDVCTLPQVHLIAVAIQSLQGVMLLSCNGNSPYLTMVKVVSVPGECFIPTRVSASCSGELLWMISGLSKMNGGDQSWAARLRVLGGLNEKVRDQRLCELGVLRDEEVPHAESLLVGLQGGVSVDEKLFAGAAKAAMNTQFVKKQYSAERREFRKRGRNDKRH